MRCPRCKKFTSPMDYACCAFDSSITIRDDVCFRCHEKISRRLVESAKKTIEEEASCFGGILSAWGGK